MVILKIEDMDLDQIAQSGQCFLWEQSGEKKYRIVSGNRFVEAAQKGNQFTFSCSDNEFTDYWQEYFDLKTDYGKIKSKAGKSDEYLTGAIQFGWGIRILKQDLWEVMASFLISQNNNITRIKNSVRLLCQTYGSAYETGLCDGDIYYTFPRPRQLTGVTERGFEEMGLGYRAKYMKELVGQLGDSRLEEFEARLRCMEEEEAMKELLSIYGIGKKVANCINLFGLYHINAFPIDTHIQKILDEHYKDGFPYASYDGYLGIIQQYLFYYDLKG